jgi:hypothetical protein
MRFLRTWLVAVPLTAGPIWVTVWLVNGWTTAEYGCGTFAPEPCRRFPLPLSLQLIATGVLAVVTATAFVFALFLRPHARHHTEDASS